MKIGMKDGGITDGKEWARAVYEGKNRTGIFVYSVVCLVGYSESETVFETGMGRLTVRGTGLSVTAFRNRSVEVRGRVTSVVFSEEEE